MGILMQNDSFVGGIDSSLVNKIGTAPLDTVAQDLSGAVNELKATGGGGNVDDVYVNGVSVLDSNKIAQIDLTGKVNKSGDTMTGDLDNSASFANKFSGVQIDTSSNNHVSENTQLMSAGFKDNSGFVYSGINTQVSTSGLVETWLSVKNKKTDGSVVNNYIDLLIAKDGTMSYVVADPAAFRSAIGLTTNTTTLTNPVSQVYAQHITKKNDVVYLYVDINNLNTTTEVVIGTIPSGYRPQHRINYEALVISSSDASFKGYAHINIQPNGNISYKSLGSYSGSFTTINIAYPVN